MVKLGSVTLVTVKMISPLDGCGYDKAMANEQVFRVTVATRRVHDSRWYLGHSHSWE
jgi:hypothetical protein